MTDVERVRAALATVGPADTTAVAEAAGLGRVPASLALHALWRAGRATYEPLFGWRPGGEVRGEGGRAE